jgi:hypothetical protein
MPRPLTISVRVLSTGHISTGFLESIIHQQPFRIHELQSHRSMLTRQNRKGNVALSTPKFLPPPMIQVNRRTCRFVRYKNPRRPHPPPRGSQVSRYPPRVSSLTLAHPLAHPPPSAHPIELPYADPFWAPGQRGQWAPTMVSFVAPHTKVGSNVTLNCTLTFREIHQWNT